MEGDGPKVRILSALYRVTQREGRSLQGRNAVLPRTYHAGTLIIDLHFQGCEKQTSTASEDKYVAFCCGSLNLGSLWRQIKEIREPLKLRGRVLLS